MARKLAAGSIFTTDDQARLYEEMMGAEAAERQRALADKEARRCSCHPTSVKRRWENADKQTSRRVHHPACAKWKPWMEEGQSQARWET